MRNLLTDLSVGHAADFVRSSTPGRVGAGTGATTATVKGRRGSASALTSTGFIAAARTVVNAIGAGTGTMTSRRERFA